MLIWNRLYTTQGQMMVFNLSKKPHVLAFWKITPPQKGGWKENISKQVVIFHFGSPGGDQGVINHFFSSSNHLWGKKVEQQAKSRVYPHALQRAVIEFVAFQSHPVLLMCIYLLILLLAQMVSQSCPSVKLSKKWKKRLRAQTKKGSLPRKHNVIFFKAKAS